jgi:hypothetical protein
MPDGLPRLEGNVLKIADFGLARKFVQTTRMTAEGTYAWMVCEHVCVCVCVCVCVGLLDQRLIVLCLSNTHTHTHTQYIYIYVYILSLLFLCVFAHAAVARGDSQQLLLHGERRVGLRRCYVGASDQPGAIALRCFCASCSLSLSVSLSLSLSLSVSLSSSSCVCALTCESPPFANSLTFLRWLTVPRSRTKACKASQ